MPTLKGYQNRFSPQTDLKAGPIIAPRGTSFGPQEIAAISTGKGTLAAAAALEKVGEVFAQVADKRKTAAHEFYNVQASRDLGLLMGELDQIKDPDEQQSLYDKRTTDLYNSYREPLQKAGVNIERDFSGTYNRVRSSFDVKFQAMKTKTAMADTENMIRQTISAYEVGAATVGFDEAGEEIAKKQLEGAKILINENVGTLWQQAEAETMTANLVRNTATKRISAMVEANPQMAIDKINRGIFDDALPTADLVVLRQRAVNHQRAMEAESLRLAEKAERDAEKQTKEAQEVYADGLFGKLYDGKLTVNEVETAGRKRLIPHGEYRQLLNALKTEGGKEENDPMTVGDLGARLGMGADIGPDLDKARRTGKIKTETYITLKGQLANRNFKRGADYISKALRPGEMDRFDQEKNLRYATAMDDYIARISSAEDDDTIGVAKDIVFETLSRKRSAFMSLPSPLFLEGPRSELGNLNQARIATTEKFKSGSLREDEYKREIRLIDTLTRMLREQQLADQAADDEDGSAKDRLNRAKKESRRK